MNLQYKFEVELSRCALFEMCEACLSPERVAYNSRLPSLQCSKCSSASGYLTVMVNATISTVCIATYFRLFFLFLSPNFSSQNLIGTYTLVPIFCHHFMKSRCHYCHQKLLHSGLFMLG